jgi:hypothetical protein
MKQYCKTNLNEKSLWWDNVNTKGKRNKKPDGSLKIKESVAIETNWEVQFRIT